MTEEQKQKIIKLRILLKKYAPSVYERFKARKMHLQQPKEDE